MTAMKSVFMAECEIWCEELVQLKLKSSHEVLSVLENCDETLFPNINRLLRVLITLPITTCTAERSLSTMKRIKTSLRNCTGDERLSDCAILSSHWDIEVYAEEVLDVMTLKNRRILL